MDFWLVERIHASEASRKKGRLWYRWNMAVGDVYLNNKYRSPPQFRHYSQKINIILDKLKYQYIIVA